MCIHIYLLFYIVIFFFPRSHSHTSSHSRSHTTIHTYNNTHIHNHTAKYKQLLDAWVCAGSPPQAKATWDLQLNDNKKMEGASFTPRMRLDRLLLNRAWVGGGGGGGKGKGGGGKEEKGVVKGWELLGKERMSEGVFPSDHFGMSCLLKVPGCVGWVEEGKGGKGKKGGGKGEKGEESEVIVID